jgi:hypothetical protein
LDNICLMCRTHSRDMAEIDYGTKALARHLGSAWKRGKRPQLVSDAARRGPVPEPVAQGISLKKGRTLDVPTGG